MICNEFKHPQVRDLAWSCFSEPILHSPQLASDIQNCKLQLTPARAEWLKALDNRPEPLLEQLSMLVSTRLGIYFETLWQFFIEHDPGLDLVAHNLAVRDGGKTLGEFDVIYFDKAEQHHVHLELAVKFYMGLPNTGRWLGPGKQDQLAKKIDHLIHKQIRLDQHLAARETLNHLGIGQMRHQIELKGYLFAPGSTGNTATPKAWNPRNAIASWQFLPQFIAELETKTNWRALERRQWLSPFRQNTQDRAWHQVQLEQWLETHVNGRQQPQLLVRCNAHGDEVERRFIAPVNWHE